MTRLERHFADYEANHQDPRNRTIHGVGIPLIALALLGLASRVPAAMLSGAMSLDLGMALVAGMSLFYLTWSPVLALSFAVFMTLLYLLAGLVPFPWLWPLLAAGVALQYLGHFLEGRQPAFHRNLIHTLVGPLWIVSRPLRALGLWRERGGGPAHR